MVLNTGQYKLTSNDVDETGLCSAVRMIYTIIRHFLPGFDIIVEYKVWKTGWIRKEKAAV
jgi:hypothetical protein